MIKAKRKLKNQIEKHKRRELKPEANHLDTQIKNAIREHREQKSHERWNNTINKNPYNYYNIAQHILKPKNSHTTYPIRDNQGNPIHNDSDKIKAFEELYTEIYKPPNPLSANDDQRKLTTEVNKTVQKIREYQKPIGNKIESEINNPITVEDLRQALKKSKHTAPGEDQIYYQHLSELPLIAFEHLSTIYTKCLEINYYPQAWKIGITILLPKPNKDHSKIENYRPITLLNTVGKTFERIINTRLKSFCESKNLFPPSQAGFRSGQSTQDQLVKLVEETQRGIIKNQYTMATFFDINKAFDKIWHEALIHKLLHLHKLNINTVQLLTDFLTNRKIKLKINSSHSGEITLKAGTPQGAILSPTLFNLWVADIPQPHLTSRLSQFADDIATWVTDKSPLKAQAKAQAYNDEISEWCDKWRISLAANKTQFIVFYRKKTADTGKYDQVVKGSKIKAQNTITFLGMTLDETIKLHEHHKIVIQRLRQRTALFTRITGTTNKPNLNSTLSTQILKSMIIPIIYYAPTVTCIMKKKFFELQDKIIKAAGRKALHAPSTISGEYVLSKLNIKPSYDRTLEVAKKYLMNANRSKAIKYFIQTNTITGTQLSKINKYPTPLTLLANPFNS